MSGSRYLIFVVLMVVIRNGWSFNYLYDANSPFSWDEDNIELKNRGFDEEAFYDSLFQSRKRQQSRSGSGLTRAQKNKIVELHNTLRQGEGASNMQRINYSEKLAQLAQDWSDRCIWGHRPHDSFLASDYGFNRIGENIWVYAGIDNQGVPEQPIRKWFDEKNNYNYNSDYCARPPCGHYTQVVWSSTTEIGCGLTRCSSMANFGMSNAQYFVCNYGPGGNMMGEKPYKLGLPCSECNTGSFYCTNGLCDHTCRQAGSGNKCKCAAQCVNGQQAANGCKCRCNAGFSGVSCNELCEDKDKHCGANPGWPVSFCHDKSLMDGYMYDTVNEKCPKLCGKCR